jgi:hypothetical protein
MTTATSSEDEHRGHRCPGSTFGYFRLRSISAGTVWVQIGQWTIPFVWLSMNAFMATLPHFIRRDFPSTGCTKFVKILKTVVRPVPAGRCYADHMTQQPAPKIQLVETPEYRENYANSVQVRVNLWDFLLLFGRVNQTSQENVTIHNFQAVYVSPQQAKALLNVLQQNVNQYETAFGEIRLEPSAGSGIVQ